MGVLEGKVAIVTGASSGIGRAIALRFAHEGAAVVLTARRRPLLEEVAGEIRRTGGRAAVTVGDVREPRTHEDVACVACSEFGGLDIAVNNAGHVGPMKPLGETSLGEWQETIDTNLTAAYLGARTQVRVMVERGGGAIVFVSSFVGTSVGLPGMAAYGASKAALVGLVKGVTADYGALGIRANALLPGGVDTPMAGSQEQKAWAAGLHALKRIASPSEIAAAALFLASPGASFVVGTALFVDGGNAAVKWFPTREGTADGSRAPVRAGQAWSPPCGWAALYAATILVCSCAGTFS